MYGNTCKCGEFKPHPTLCKAGGGNNNTTTSIDTLAILFLRDASAPLLVAPDYQHTATNKITKFVELAADVLEIFKYINVVYYKYQQLSLLAKMSIEL